MSYRHKIGDTFKIYGPLKIEGATDYSTWTGKAQLRDPNDKLIADLSFSWLDASTGIAQLHFNGSTEDWPICTARLDVELTAGAGDIVRTPTAQIELTQGVTR